MNSPKNYHPSISIRIQLSLILTEICPSKDYQHILSLNLLKIFHESRDDQIFSPKVNLHEKQYEKACENSQEMNSTNIGLEPGTPLEISNDLSLLPRSKIQESSHNTLVMPFIPQMPYNSTMKMPSESVPNFLDIVELNPVNSTFLQAESQQTYPDDYMLKTLKEKFDYNPVLDNQTYTSDKCDQISQGNPKKIVTI